MGLRTNANIFKSFRLIFKILLEAYITFEFLRYKIWKGIKHVLTCLIDSLNLLKGTSGSISLNCSAVESQEELCLNSWVSPEISGYFTNSCLSLLVGH